MHLPIAFSPYAFGCSDSWASPWQQPELSQRTHSCLIGEGELVPVEGVAHVEEASALLGGDGAHVVDDRGRRGVLCPVCVDVVERAAAYAQPVPAALRVANVGAHRYRGRVALENQL